MKLSKRSILLRVEPSGAPDAVAPATKDAISNGFDGFEIVLPEVDEPEIARPAPRRVIAVAGICRSTDVAIGLAEVSTLLQTAGEFGATCLNLTLPPIDGREGGAGFSRYQDGLNFVYRVLYELRHDAESCGVAIAVEAATGGGLLSPVELREIINQANSPAVGVCLDVTCVERVGVVEDWIATLGYRIKSVRVGSIAKDALDSLVGVLDLARCDAPVIVHDLVT